MIHQFERYSIDSGTLLFHGLRDEALRAEMLSVTEALVLVGTMPHPRPAWMTDWMQAGGFDEGQFLLVVSTVLPARVFLSLLRSAQ